MRTITEISASGVVFRRTQKGVQVALIVTRGGEVLSLPKGHVEPGEDLEDAALREVKEETGLVGEIIAPLGVIDFWYVWPPTGERVRRHKFVHFFLMRYVEGDTKDHDFEVDEVRWVDLDDAIETVSYDNLKPVLTRAKEAISNLSG
jgi:8-oxo-dGTP pyrophosphatase MutT (NUDIX family)